MVKISDHDLPEIARLYNNSGKDAMYKHLRETYGIKNPWFVLSRMKKAPVLGYDAESDRFTAEACDQADENLFMTMDELCSPMKPQHVTTSKQNQCEQKAEAMEALVKQLIGDRLLELSKYVVLDTINKTMLVDKTALETAGYSLVTH